MHDVGAWVVHSKEAGPVYHDSRLCCKPCFSCKPKVFQKAHPMKLFLCNVAKRIYEFVLKMRRETLSSEMGEVSEMS